MKRSILLLILTLIHLSVIAQWCKIGEISLLEIDQFNQDQQGNIYVATVRGDIKKYSEDGSLLAEYSSSLSGDVHQLDATSQLKVLIFYQDLQAYLILDRYLRAPANYFLNDFGVGFVSDISTNFQQNVWVVDRSDFTLKMLNPRRNVILEKISLAKLLDSNTSDIASFIIHQNKLYLTDLKKGTFIFDSIGNFEGKLELVNNGDFKFYQDHMYYSSGDMLVLSHLYNGEIRRIKTPKSEMKKILYNENRLVHFTDAGFVIYKYLSGK